MAKAADPREYATLFLARAIIEGDKKAVKAALDANANPAAFWIDGRTTLAQLARERGPASLAALLDPIALGKLPKLKGDEDGRAVWTPAFVQFVVARGFQFTRRTTPRDGGRGSEKPGFDSAKAAARFVGRTAHSLEDAHCQGSSWTLRYGADWKGDKRVVGFEIRFKTSIEGLDMLQLYMDKKAAGQAADWPDDDAPEVQEQKEWEGQLKGYELLFNCANPTFEMALAALRGGANPFAVEGAHGDQRGKPCLHYQDERALMLVRSVRGAVGEGPGWRQRVKPLLTKKGVAALMERAQLEAVALPAGEKQVGAGAPRERDRVGRRL